MYNQKNIVTSPLIHKGYSFTLSLFCPYNDWLVILVPLVDSSTSKKLNKPRFVSFHLFSNVVACHEHIQPKWTTFIDPLRIYVHEANRYFKWNSVLCACFWITNMVFLDNCICSVNNLYFMVHWHSLSASGLFGDFALQVFCNPFVCFSIYIYI